MNANFSKRFSAFIIDLFIVSIISSLLALVIPTSKNYENLSLKLADITEEYSTKLLEDAENVDISYYEKYIDEASPISYQMEKESFISKILVLVVYILYYVVYQFKNNGQTLGKKLMKIKVEKQDGQLQINDLIFRSFIINSVLSSLIYIILLFTTKNITYMLATEVISIIFGVIMIISGLMCVIRKDNKTLQDVLTKTQVVEVK